MVDAWGIPCHVWGKEIKVMLDNSYIHLSAWWSIEDPCRFKQRFALYRQPSGWLIPMIFSICFNFSPISGVAMNSSFSNHVSTGKGFLWKFTFSFVFPPQYFFMICLMIWYVWSILIPCSLYIMVILRIFGVGPSWKI